MNGQNLVLLGVGLFVGLVVGVAAVDYYLINEHDPMDPEGLIWHVQTTFSRISDLQADLVVDGNESSEDPLRVRIYYVSGPEGGLSLRYLPSESLSDEMFVVQEGTLSHYLPGQGIVINKRWPGVPLADIGFFSLNLVQLEEQRKAGTVKLNVRTATDTTGFDMNMFGARVVLDNTFARTGSSSESSKFFQLEKNSALLPRIADINPHPVVAIVQGWYILEVRGSTNKQRLMRTVWVSRHNYMVRRIVYFDDTGERTRTIDVRRIRVDEGVSPELLPRAKESIEG